MELSSRVAVRSWMLRRPPLLPPLPKREEPVQVQAQVHASALLPLEEELVCFESRLRQPLPLLLLRPEEQARVQVWVPMSLLSVVARVG